MVKLICRKKAKTFRLKASTLIETIIAMVIVTISFGIGVTIYMNIRTGGNPLIRIKAYSEANNLYNQTMHQQDFKDKAFVKENVKISKKITAYPGNEELKILQIRVMDLNEHEIFVKRQIIYPSKYE